MNEFGFTADWPKPHPVDWAVFKAAFWVDLNLIPDDEWQHEVDQAAAHILGWAE